MSELTLPPRARERVAIVGARIVPMDRPGVIDGHAIVVEDGVITAVVPAALVDRENTRLIDATGRFVMPGLADMHVHWNSFTQLGMYLANGVTTVRNMWGAPWHLAMARAIDEGRFPGPRLVTTSPGFDGYLPGGGTIWPGSIAVSSAADVDEIVDRVVERGYRQIKAYELLDVPTLQMICARATTAGVDVVGHCPETMTMETAIEAGMRSFEHLQNLHVGRLREASDVPPREDRVRRVRAIANGLDLESVARLGIRLREEGVWSCPTLTLWDGWRPSRVDHDDPLLRYLSPGISSAWTLEGRGITGVDVSAYDAALEAVRQTWTTAVRILHDSGAPILLGTDHDNPWVFAGFAIHDEVENLMDAGFTAYEALRAGTVDAARFLCEEGRWGQVTVGARADLLILRDNPLADPATIRSPLGVLTNGWYLTPADLASLLQAHEREMHRSGDEAPRDHRVLDSIFGGSPSGCCSYRHHNEDDGVVFEEFEQEGTAASSWSGRLDRSGAIESMRVERRTPPFVSITTVTRTGHGYEVVTEDLDGWTEARSLSNEALFPSAITAGALLPDGEVDLLYCDVGDVVVAPSLVQSTQDERVIEVKAPSYATTRHYRLEDGVLVAIWDMYLGWRRTWTARS